MSLAATGSLWILIQIEEKSEAIYKTYWPNSWPGSSVGIATEVRAGRSGIESQWGRNFPTVQTVPGAHSTSYKMGTGSFPRVKCSRSVLLTSHPLLVPRSWKSRAIPLPTFWATPGLWRDHFIFNWTKSHSIIKLSSPLSCTHCTNMHSIHVNRCTFETWDLRDDVLKEKGRHLNSKTNIMKTIFLCGIFRRYILGKFLIC